MTEPSRHVPTIADVARAAGVSKTTASRVLNGSPHVAEPTRKRVRQAMSKLGFIASQSARSLALGRSQAIGIISSEPLDELLEDPTYGMLLRGISERASTLDHVIMLFQAWSTTEVETLLRVINQGIVDALVHISPHHDRGLLAELAKLPLPVALCGKPPNALAAKHFNAVYSDDVIGARALAAHLCEQGTNRPAIILGPDHDSASADRLIGYREALGELFDEQLVVAGEWGAAAGRAGALELLERDDTIDAILCASDRIARGVLSVLHARGLKVPADVRVLGFDDHHFAEQLDPPLTTIAQPFGTQGTRAIDLVLAQMAGAKPSVEVLHSRLVVRQST